MKLFGRLVVVAAAVCWFCDRYRFELLCVLLLLLCLVLGAAGRVVSFEAALVSALRLW